MVPSGEVHRCCWTKASLLFLYKEDELDLNTSTSRFFLKSTIISQVHTPRPKSNICTITNIYFERKSNSRSSVFLFSRQYFINFRNNVKKSDIGFLSKNKIKIIKYSYRKNIMSEFWILFN